MDIGNLKVRGGLVHESAVIKDAESVLKKIINKTVENHGEISYGEIHDVRVNKHGTVEGNPHKKFLILLSSVSVDRDQESAYTEQTMGEVEDYFDYALEEQGNTNSGVLICRFDAEVVPQ